MRWWMTLVHLPEEQHKPGDDKEAGERRNRSLRGARRAGAAVGGDRPPREATPVDIMSDRGRGKSAAILINHKLRSPEWEAAMSASFEERSSGAATAGASAAVGLELWRFYPRETRVLARAQRLTLECAEAACHDAALRAAPLLAEAARDRGFLFAHAGLQQPSSAREEAASGIVGSVLGAGGAAARAAAGMVYRQLPAALTGAAAAASLQEDAAAAAAVAERRRRAWQREEKAV